MFCASRTFSRPTYPSSTISTSASTSAVSAVSSAAAAAAKSLQSCPTLCDPIDCSPPGSTIPGILQARILEWVASALPRGSSQPRDHTHVSHCKLILYPLSHQGSWRILDRVAYPFSRGSFWPRNRTRVSWIAGEFFTMEALYWATMEVQWLKKNIIENNCALWPSGIYSNSAITLQHSNIINLIQHITK